MRRLNRTTLAGVGSLFLTVTLGVLAGCSHKDAPGPASMQAPAPTIAEIKGPSEPADYVGNEACRSCHPTEFDSHGKSRHAHTLNAVSVEALGSRLPNAGRIPGSEIELTRASGRLLMAVAGEARSALPLTVAFGSGKVGITFGAELPTGELLEMRKSYVPGTRSWYITPGHENKPKSDIGVVYTHQQAQDCVHCHATTVEPRDILPPKKFRGIGCEGCHGPASLHVAAMHTQEKPGVSNSTATPNGGRDIKIARLSAMGARQQNHICGRCHRSEEHIDPNSELAPFTNRFQAYGLSKSRCYKESRDTLTCSRCHNPHTDAVTRAADYEAVCLSCHRAGAVASSHVAPGKVCP